ncbi:MAG TPA: hypothetical protein VKY92_18900 [Verrucomicrobiae bacterium]|nr:hypothetical protein [Verrucomicrobiae bacterium]
MDAKVRELRLLLHSLPESADALKNELEGDSDFSENSRRVRLEAVANYCRTALKFLDSGLIEKAKPLIQAPDLTKLTGSNLALHKIIADRWIEAQKCQHSEAYLASVILMGSILEALLLSRAVASMADACHSSRAPRDKTGQVKQVHDWNLNALIDVAVELGWLKVDRGKFSHALRESRNVVHPWQHAAIKADFDEATCKTCWHVLNASVEDILKSI